MLTVLVVDDSALMRRTLREALEAEADIEVAFARDGEDALEQVQRVAPDVITLDIHMPVMDGLTCLSHLMVDKPCPVIMVSSLTEKGALATFEALELGAFDYVAKPGGTVSRDIESIRADLVAKVRAAVGQRTGTQRPRPEPAKAAAPAPAPAPKGPATSASGDRLLLIGVSTGGPRTLEGILPKLSGSLDWPVLVIQHMPASFTGVFARRLDGLCGMPVREVDRPSLLEPGVIYMARGDADITLSRRPRGLNAVPSPAAGERLWHPSVSRFLQSAEGILDATDLVGVLLTGMGDDGAPELAQWRARGARTIAESEETAVVFGMSQELINRDGATEVLPAGRVADRLNAWLNTGGVASCR